MTAPARDRTRTTTTIGGGLLALAGLLLLLLILSDGGAQGLLVLSALALAAGACVLAIGVRGDDIVGGSWIGRIALVVTGVGPLLFGVVFAFPIEGVPWLALTVGLTQIAIVTLATVVATVQVARQHVLHGFARWVLVLLAVDALLGAAMSTVVPPDAALVYLSLRLDLLRPLALLIAGVAFVLHGQAGVLRDQLGRVNEVWRRTTEVGGLDRDPLPHETAKR